MSSVELEGVEKYFGATHAVGPVSLAVGEGEFLSLLGPSGCGKSTTLRMIAGFEQPSAGTISIGAKAMNDVPVEHRGIGMVFQSYALFPHLTVADNVAFGLRVRKLGRAEIEAKVKACLSLVGLGPYADRMPSQISGGQQQRVALARAMAIEPALLLLDEPLSNLDLKMREVMRDEIRGLQRRLGITAVYVTHDQGEAMSMSDRIAIMNRGRIEQIGPPRAIYERPATLFVGRFVGQCSVFDGTYAGREHGRAVFASQDGLRFVSSASDEGAVRRVGQPLSLLIRPEAVVLRATDGDENRITARVDDVVYMGDTTSVTLKLPTGATLVASQRNILGPPLPERGSVIEIAVPARNCVLLDGADPAANGTMAS